MLGALKDSWLFPVIQSVHLAGLVALVGTIALVDLRILGLGIQSQSASRVAAELKPWTSAGLLTVLFTGPLLFGADIPRYFANPAFLVKMVLLGLALLTHFTIRGKGKLAAVVSLALWSCVVLAGRAIADFDIL